MGKRSLVHVSVETMWNSLRQYFFLDKTIALYFVLNRIDNEHDRFIPHIRLISRRMLSDDLPPLLIGRINTVQWLFKVIKRK